MPRLTKKLPSYRLHKPSGRAVVSLNGTDHYLGGWDTPESRAAYDRLIAEWLAAGRGRPKAEAAPRPDDPTVAEMVLAFWRHAETHYRGPDREPTHELVNLKEAMRPVVRLYARTPARSFGPLALRAVRDVMVKSGLARTTVNARINRVRRAFKWAASVEMIPPAVVQALGTVDGLREGRSEARETEPIKPVPVERVEAVLAALPRPVAAMVRLQLLTGCRTAEVRAMRACDLVVGDPVWEYRPARHKNAWRGQARVIALGPRAVEIVKEFLKPDTTAYLFSPADAVGEMRARRGKARQSRPTPSELARRRKRKAGKRPAPCYDRRSYRQAVSRACDKAFPHPEEAELKAAANRKGQTREGRKERREALKAWRHEHAAELAEWRDKHRWTPLQLRHTAATVIRAKYGLEAAQNVLGHAKADVTQLYAERDEAKARSIAAEIG